LTLKPRDNFLNHWS